MMERLSGWCCALEERIASPCHNGKTPCGREDKRNLKCWGKEVGKPAERLVACLQKHFAYLDLSSIFTLFALGWFFAIFANGT
jgi:hypothetical protein